ncbi:MAG: ATP-binding cassette domain-containing protein [Chloroflexota bacterium]|nr:ATP-binding cassette domain-containing protein [Chloroflexota bacterium]
MENGLAIQVKALDRKFDEIHAVKEVSFNVESGEIFSLLGPNGAGKTTTISMLSCLLKPDGGDAFVMGYSILEDPRGVKSSIGVVPQEIALYEDLSARENLEFWGKMYGLHGAILKQRVDEVLELIGLTERQKGRIEKYSGGMKRRVNIGVALLHTPNVIIMDEPTAGIDPQSRRHILDGVKALNEQGVTVLYTTHYMEEAQELSNHIAIMDHGDLIAIGTHDELVQIVGEQDRIDLQLSQDSSSLLERWRGIDGVNQVTVEDGGVCVLADDSNRVLPPLFEMANEEDVRITSVEIQEPNLETVFLHLTGRALRD